jgi:soluble lytic murein transglycosylase
MIRFLFKLIICLLLAAAAGVAVIALRSGDPVYAIYEWVSPARFQQYDPLIRSVGAAQQVDPLLIKAIIWRESRFDAQQYGSAGERGLMQVTEVVANEWARENRVADFRVEDLFDPKRNVEIGTWYLHRALQHWQKEKDAVPFALAEYNAGPSRAQRWAGGEKAPPLAPKEFRRNIDFPGTRKYVEAIIARRDFYRRRGRM